MHVFMPVCVLTLTGVSTLRGGVFTLMYTLGRVLNRVTKLAHILAGISHTKLWGLSTLVAELTEGQA